MSDHLRGSEIAAVSDPIDRAIAAGDLKLAAALIALKVSAGAER